MLTCLSVSLCKPGVVLQMKSMGIDKVVSFPFPTPPDMIGLKEAHRVRPPVQQAVHSHAGSAEV
jgi:hypothetical protein